MADPEGKFKCQESAQVSVSALFSDDELATFAAFVAEVGFEPDQHWRLSPCQTQADCPAAGDPEEHPTTPTGGAADAAGSAASSLARRRGPACACPSDSGVAPEGSVAPRRRRPAPLPVKADKAVLAEHNAETHCVTLKVVCFYGKPY
eukprot:scaffold21489_cov67-Phaeocystis_antarctica.AAC.3